jgi:hypothetical protein
MSDTPRKPVASEEQEIPFDLDLFMWAARRGFKLITPEDWEMAREARKTAAA